MPPALDLAAHRPSEFIACLFDRLSKAVGALLDRAMAAVGGGIPCLTISQAGRTALRMVEVFADGLRVRPSSR